MIPTSNDLFSDRYYESLLRPHLPQRRSNGSLFAARLTLGLPRSSMPTYSYVQCTTSISSTTPWSVFQSAVTGSKRYGSPAVNRRPTPIPPYKPKVIAVLVHFPSRPYPRAQARSWAGLPGLGTHHFPYLATTPPEIQHSISFISYRTAQTFVISPLSGVHCWQAPSKSQPIHSAFAHSYSIHPYVSNSVV